MGSLHYLKYFSIGFPNGPPITGHPESMLGSSAYRSAVRSCPSGSILTPPRATRHNNMIFWSSSSVVVKIDNTFLPQWDRSWSICLSFCLSVPPSIHPWVCHISLKLYIISLPELSSLYISSHLSLGALVYAQHTLPRSHWR